jgi:hypothetical protein
LWSVTSSKYSILYVCHDVDYADLVVCD